jgi:hypothetical protein
VAYNFSSAATTVALPEASRGRQWYPAIDSSNEAQPFVKDPDVCTGNRVMVKSQAILVLVSKKAEAAAETDTETDPVTDADAETEKEQEQE